MEKKEQKVHLSTLNRQGPPKGMVYVCSRYAGKDREEVEENVRQAREYSRFVVRHEAVPVTPHLLYPQFLDDGDWKEREIGKRCGLWLLTCCDELWIFWRDGISEGMREEIRWAARLGKKVRFINSYLLDEEGVLNESDL